MGGMVRATRTVELPVYPLVELVRREGLGDPHPVLAGGERYVSHRFAAQAEQDLRERLAAAGLGHRDALDEFVEDVGVAQRATAEFYGWVADGLRRYSVLATALGRRAVVLTRDGDRVTVERGDPERLASALVARLPEVPAAAGEPISARTGDVGRRGGREPGAVLRRSAPSRPEGARRLEALAAQPRRGGAKLYAAARDRAGVRRRAADWVTVLDLAAGRWALYSSGRGERAVNAAPGTSRLLTDKLDELRRTLPR